MQSLFFSQTASKSLLRKYFFTGNVSAVAMETNVSAFSLLSSRQIWTSFLIYRNPSIILSTRPYIYNKKCSLGTEMVTNFEMFINISEPVT